MVENKMNEIVSKIEKLITDGQKELISRLDRLEVGQQNLEVRMERLEVGQKRLEKRLEAKIDHVDQKHETNTKALYGLLQDTKNELKEKIDQVECKLADKIGQVESRLDKKIDKVEQTLGGKIDRIECKLDVHMRQPAHA